MYVHQKTREIENKTNNSIKSVIGGLDIHNKNILNQFNENIFYKYTENLTIKNEETKKLWLNNEEKEQYYEKILNNNYIDFVNKLVNRYNNINNRLNNNLFKKFDIIKEMQYISNNRLNSFVNYINQRDGYMKHDYKSCKIGIEGEAKVNKELSIFNNYINLENIRLEVLDNENNLQSIENDNILLTRNGIFVLEVKNLGEIGNYDIVIEKDGRWLKKNRYNNELTIMKNVTSQNNRHIGFLNKFINESMNTSFDNYIEVDGIIVIANEKVTIENYNENQNIFRISELHAYIKKQPVKFTKEELDNIKKIIEKNNLPSKKYPIYRYYDEIQENIQSLQKFINKYERIVNSIIQLDKQFKQEYDKISLSVQKERSKAKRKINIIIIFMILLTIVSTVLIKYMDNYKVKKRYDEAEGLTVIKLNNNLYGYEDENGKRVIKAQFEYAQEFSEGLAPVMKDGKYGYIDKSGKFVIEPQFEHALAFSEGMALASKKYKYGYIDKSGEFVIKPQFEHAENFSEGLAIIRETDWNGYGYTYRHGYIDKSGNVVIEPKFEKAQAFSEGLAVVKKDHSYGYIDKNGNFVIEPKFDRAESFNEGLAKVRMYGGYVYINKKGEIVEK